MESKNVHPVQNVLDRINEAAKRGGRSATNITLVAVSKTKPIEDIVAAYHAGVRHFGENRANELAEKAAALSHLPDIQWHFIGHLQTRQSNPVAEHAHYFHAVDRIKIAERLSTQLQELDRTLPVFIEVNISGEESKGGFKCADWENNQEQRDTISRAMRSIAALPNIQVCGLMTMAPWTAPEATLRDIFSRLRRLSEWLNSHFPEQQATELSMGMSGDFEIAIEEGATCVRVGSAIFGKRG
ncbi:MAG: YggS family pyridoxal phosphate-dependent enzyme [Pseudomonadota bacterium]